MRRVLRVQKCIVHVEEGFAVVHKPAGVQVAATVDNVLENVLACVAQVRALVFHAVDIICMTQPALLMSFNSWACTDCLFKLAPLGIVHVDSAIV